MNKTKTKNTNQVNPILFLLVLLLLASVGASIWYFNSYRKAKQEINYLTEQMQANQMSQEEVKNLLGEISELMILPQDQGEPMIATIKDVEQLKAAEPFYANAQNEDKLLIYKDRAIIYSPDRHKIVNVGPVYMEGGQQNQEVISIDIRNGSNTVGAASEKAEQLGKMAEFEIFDIKNAANQDYQGVTLVNLKGKNISSLEGVLGVQATNSLPEGESTSEADVMVIVGN